LHFRCRNNFVKESVTEIFAENYTEDENGMEIKAEMEEIKEKEI
jgi:hypothetical protein